MAKAKRVSKTKARRKATRRAKDLGLRSNQSVHGGTGFELMFDTVSPAPKTKRDP
jgi:hypothetical protein